MIRSPKPNSLLRRVEGFFIANPDEWLTYADMAVKFDCTAIQAAKAVENLKRLGMRIEAMHVVRRAVK